nr:serine hydrolase [Stakelama sediminis]
MNSGNAGRAILLAAVAPLGLIGCGVHQAHAPVVAQASAHEHKPFVATPPYSVAVPVPPPAAKPAAAPAALVESVKTLGRNFDGIVGISVRNIDEGWAVESNGDRPMPQQSVSKLWVAMTVLDLRDQGKISLNDPITLTKADMTLFHQPVAALIGKDGYSTTVGRLMHRALTTSDNTANDKLLWLAGGPSAVRAFLAKRHLDNIRFGPGERLLQSKTAGLTWQQSYSQGRNFYQARAALPMSVRRDAFQTYIANPPDGAGAAAVTNALMRLKKGQLLSAASTSWLVSTLQDSRTGKNRLHGAVPGDWVFGHKTGTGQDLNGKTAGYNDVAILTAPNGESYAVAVMIGETARTIPQRWTLMHGVVNAVVAANRDDGIRMASATNGTGTNRGSD